MAFDQRLYANNAKTTLASSISDTDTTIFVDDTSLFPTITRPGQYFLVTIDSGTDIEIVRVTGVSGQNFVNCLRGQEGSTPSSFSLGTRVENRATKETYESFARLIDRVANINSVDDIPTPGNTTANSYLCASLDDEGAPIVAVQNQNLWRFVGFPTVVASGLVGSAGSAVMMPFASTITLNITQVGSHIVQFVSGANAGLCRLIQGADSNGLNWLLPLPYPVVATDRFELYQSTGFSLKALALSSTGDDALIYAILFGE
jgi:hypothetical protein